MLPCPECGQPTAAEAVVCENCGHALVNGSVSRSKNPAGKPSPPPEVSGWVIDPTPPEVIEELRRTFNEAEYLADLREVERTGGVQFGDILSEIESLVKRRD
jgi:uncharacterized protein related to proFAR isomerase